MITYVVVAVAGVALVLSLAIGGSVLFSLLEKLVWPGGIHRPDDRGRPVCLHDPKSLPRGQFSYREFERHSTRWLREHGSRPPASVLVSSLALLVTLVAIAAILIAGLPMPGLPGWTVSLALPLLSFAFYRTTRRQIAGWRSQALVSFGCCGSCGYALRDLPASSDGCVVCPECGSAWRTSRFDPSAATVPP